MQRDIYYKSTHFDFSSCFILRVANILTFSWAFAKSRKAPLTRMFVRLYILVEKLDSL